MSVYVGIDVHRKRSQVAVVTEDGTVQLNKNVVNGTEPMLRLTGGLPSGTPVASGAASGWSWLAGLLEDYGCLAVTGGLAPVTGRIDGELHAHARAGPRVKALRTPPGAGEFTALVIVAETGDITRFGSARKLASWAGLTPAVRGSDLHVRHGHITRAGLGLAAVGTQPGRADRQAVPGVRPRLLQHRETAREEDRHHRDRPQAADPRLAPA
jgi:transposase IS116/IS110/IS902 family protein